MPREKVLDKQSAILEAAIAVFAERGFWDTPTSLISKTAGIADGTLFNYYSTKDDLIKDVYLEIKKDLSQLMQQGLDPALPFKEHMRHHWNTYIEWGVRNPEKFKVLNQISSSYKLDVKTMLSGKEAFRETEQGLKDCIARGEIRDYPAEYLRAMMDAQAMMTVQLVMKNKKQLAYYQTIGFDILWNGISR